LRVQDKDKAVGSTVDGEGEAETTAEAKAEAEAEVPLVLLDWRCKPLQQAHAMVTARKITTKDKTKQLQHQALLLPFPSTTTTTTAANTEAATASTTTSSKILSPKSYLNSLQLSLDLDEGTHLDSVLLSFASSAASASASASAASDHSHPLLDPHCYPWLPKWRNIVALSGDTMTVFAPPILSSATSAPASATAEDGAPSVPTGSGSDGVGNGSSGSDSGGIADRGSGEQVCERLAEQVMTAPLVYWSAVGPQLLLLVTPTAVFTWRLAPSPSPSSATATPNTNTSRLTLSQPVKLFNRIDLADPKRSVSIQSIRPCIITSVTNLDLGREG
jgi:hypothetical protein